MKIEKALPTFQGKNNTKNLSAPFVFRRVKRCYVFTNSCKGVEGQAKIFLHLIQDMRLISEGRGEVTWRADDEKDNKWIVVWRYVKSDRQLEEKIRGVCGDMVIISNYLLTHLTKNLVESTFKDVKIIG